MTRKQGDQKRVEPELRQEASTAPRPVDAQGRELDQWGLPINGPARARALAELGMPDPNAEPEAWVERTDPGLTTDAVKTEANNG